MGSIEEALSLSENEKAIFILSVFEDERPLKGASGLVDWRLRGNLSRHLIRGHIEGKPDEFTYLPVRYQNGTRHVLLVGLGPSTGEKKVDPKKLASSLADRVRKLGFQRAVFSRSRFPMVEDFSTMEAAFSGIHLEVKE